jgi:hypothetical protein
MSKPVDRPTHSIPHAENAFFRENKWDGAYPPGETKESNSQDTASQQRGRDAGRAKAPSPHDPAS